LEHSRKRLISFLEEVKRLQGLEFPYPHSLEALTEIYGIFNTHLSFLIKLGPHSDPATVRAGCKSALSALFVYLPLLGFVLRSTDVRNAFEIHGPLLRLAQNILGLKTKLVLSSEWDYSPFTYIGIPVLEDFILIGLPAPESSNPLLLPLSGHELGHSVWYKNSLGIQIESLLEQFILHQIKDVVWDEYKKLFSISKKEDLENNLYAKQSWLPAHIWSLRQAEEAFCDLFGLRIFGEPVFHAFAYLLAPNIGGDRSVFYPNMRKRINILKQAAQTYGFSMPPKYEDLFEDLPEFNNAPQATLLLKIADAALDSVIDQIIALADTTANNAAIQLGTEEARNAMYEDFKRHIVPARDPDTLANILAAGWKAYLDTTLWKDHPEVKHPDAILKELVLKSIEVLEFKQITQN
jgi:hypothetical protein